MTVILLEGPDGSGKDRTQQAILKHMPYVSAFPRASRSDSGPVPHLRQWVDQTMPALRGYRDPRDAHVVVNRHPLVSELIYGPIVRGKLPDDFQHDWLRRSVQEFAHMVVVVWHLPPLDAVRVNVHDDDSPQMTGVQEHIEELHAAYCALAATWPGPRTFVHDYTQDRFHTRLIPVLDQVAVYHSIERTP
jgi:hypothetical protein